MECPRLTRRRTFRDQEALPAARREPRRQEDRILCHQGQGWRWRLIAADGFQRLIERQRPAGELLRTDQRQHRRASFGRWCVAWFTDAVEA